MLRTLSKSRLEWLCYGCKWGECEKRILMLPRLATSDMDIEVDAQTVGEWEAEFEAARKRPLEQRIRYAFIKTYKPVMDDAGFRSFDTMADYRRWCEENLPDWLGYGRI